MKNLSEAIQVLQKAGDLRIIDYPIDPVLEMAAIQRRAFACGAPCLLFTKPRTCAFPMLANLYGTRRRLEILFGKNLDRLHRFFSLMASPAAFFKRPLRELNLAPWLVNALPKIRKRVSARKVPVLRHSSTARSLPGLVSWPGDGGPFITLPVVQTEHPESKKANWGMYRVQLGGNSYGQDEVGMHYQLQRGIGIHHAASLARGQRLPAHVYVGGPPALAFAAVMPLPEGMDELAVAGLLSGERMTLDVCGNFSLPVLGEADFLIAGSIGEDIKEEGPFGDHLGYYSLAHPFPVMKVAGVWHRENAVWPFTSVGRPPQEDTVFGDLIHELTGPMTSRVFPGVSQVHAVDAAGVHPLLLAVGSERYMPYARDHKSLELARQGLNLLGQTQTALAKYLLISSPEENPELDCRDVEAFFRHFLERTSLEENLHFITCAGSDTLDYSGGSPHVGSRLLWTAGGSARRKLGLEAPGNLHLPTGFANPVLALPGVLLIEAKPNALPRESRDEDIENILCPALACWPSAESFPLVVIVDDSAFAGHSLANFLWTTFTRSDPAMDIYGPDARFTGKHWHCKPPLVIDARLKPFLPPVLEEDPEITRKIESLAASGGPLQGLF